MRTVSSFLPLDVVAEELGVDKLKVLRLIARGTLSAVRAGEGRPWRVHINTLDNFLSRNCPDLKGPAFASDGFAGAERHTCEAYWGALVSAVKDAIPGQEELAALFKGRDDAVTLVWPQTQIMRSVINAAYPMAFSPDKSGAPPYPSWRHAFLINAARDTAERVLRSKPSITPALQRLYSGPDAYGLVCDQVATDLARRSIVYSVPVSVPGSNGRLPRACVANFSLPYRQLGVAWGDVFRLAF